MAQNWGVRVEEILKRERVPSRPFKVFAKPFNDRSSQPIRATDLTPVFHPKEIIRISIGSLCGNNRGSL